MKQKDSAMLVDDFFGEANAILKDTQLREIARIKNENSVEVTKLKRIIDSMKNGKGYKENSTISKAVAFVDNDELLERRELKR